MSNNDHLYQYDVPGFLFVDPLVVLVRATFSNSGATVTASTTRRQSHPGAAITGDTGEYAVTGLPKGRDYHPVGIVLAAGDGTLTATASVANIKTFDASAGTLTFITRRSDTGAEADPVDTSVVYITLLVDQGPA
jgi:hypothetical protein